MHFSIALIAALGAGTVFAQEAEVSPPRIAERNARAGGEGANSAPPPFPPASAALVEQVQGLLDEGYQTGPKRLQAAQKRLASARNLAGDDPRLDYAYGLVLLKQGQSKQALAQFETAIGRAGTSYWPAWQALIWTHLAERQYDRGLARLDEFAALVGQAQDGTEPTEPQRDAARWMGQVLEALDKTVTVRKLHESIEQHGSRLQELLGEELSSTLQLGRDLVGERDAELSKQADAARDSAEKSRAQRKQDQAGKLDSDLQNIDKEKAASAKSAEEWKEWLDEALEKVDKELARLEKEYRTQETHSETLRQSITQIGRDLTVLDLQMSTIGSLGTAGSAASQTQQRILQRQNQLVNCQTEYNATIGQMSQTAQEGRLAFQERASIVQKYEKATGQLVKKSAELDKWSARVADKKKKLEMPAAGKGKGAKPAVDRKSVSLKSYVPLDLDDEKSRVLAAFGVSLELPGGEPPEAAK